MGIFSSETRINVAASVIRAIDDAALPDSDKTGLIKAILNSGDMAEYVMEEKISSIAVRAERMYSYAAKNYPYGLPSSQILASTKGLEEVNAVLAGIEGQPVLVDYCQFGPPNSLHIGWMKLVELYGYNAQTNQLPVLSAQKGYTVYLNDMRVVVPASSIGSFKKGALDQWGSPATAGVTPFRPTASAAVGRMRAHSPVVASSTAVEKYVAVEYTWSLPGSFYIQEDYNPQQSASAQIFITSALVDSAADYFHVKYTVNGVTKYWMYKVGLGTYPTLDVLFDQPVEVNGTFFPMVHFRSGGASLMGNPNSVPYKTSKKMLKYLGMDFEAVGEKIDSNPDADVIQQAMLTMAVPANTSNSVEQSYLFKFFDNLFYTQGRQYSSSTLDKIFGNLFSRFNGERSSIVIQDALFKMVLSDAGIYKRRIVGSIGAIGSHSSGIRNETIQTPYLDLDTGQTVPLTSNVVVHYYRKQISTYLYDEVSISDLQMTYFIYGGYTDIGDGNESILLIPLDRSITEDFSIGEREILYARSLHFVFNSLQITKVKWYQTGLFQAFIQIVGIVLTVISLGADGGTFMLLAAAIGTAGAIAITIAFYYLSNLLFSYVLKLFVKAVGAEAAMIIALVAALAGAYQIFDAGSVAGAPWAKELLQLSTGLSKTAVEDNFANLLKEYETFNLFKTAKEKKVEEANKLLEETNFLSPFVIFGETPNDFYNRTIHSSNPGMISISAISAYVDTALTLPKLDATLGENTYG